MTNHSRNTLTILALCSAAAAVPAATPTYRVVANMSAGKYVAPVGILEGAPGLFYFTAANTGGVVLSVTTQGTLTALAQFMEPPYALQSASATAANGLLYAEVQNVSGALSANVISVGPSPGSEKTYPSQTLVPELAGNLPDGNLFGLTYNSSNQIGLATVDLQGNVTQFYQFPNPYPTHAFGPPILGADGNYYGVAQIDQTATAYFYRVTPAGSASTVATLPFVLTEYAGLGLVLQGSDGNFYGVQSAGLGCPSSQHGAVYKLTPGGQYSILYQFQHCYNSAVNTLIEASDGKLYGVTQNGNTMFSLTTSGGSTAIPGLPGLCPCQIVQGSDGIIYGTAEGGGMNGAGVVFALDAGLPIPKPQAAAFHPQSGAVGTRVRIWGHHLLNASVQFNGTPATNVHSSGPNYVWATVPADATSGPITVTTPGGTSTTKGSFTVQ